MKHYYHNEFEELVPLLEEKKYWKKLKEDTPENRKELLECLREIFYIAKYDWFLKEGYKGEELDVKSKLYILSIVDVFNNDNGGIRGLKRKKRFVDNIFSKNLEILVKE